MDKWEELKRWVMDRHDWLEKQYGKTNFSADAAEQGAYRAVYQTMCDLDRRATQQSDLPVSATPRRRR